MDEGEGIIDSTPWLACRQCSRKEKMPSASSSVHKSSKFSAKWSESTILENTDTGGYPEADPELFDPANLTFPIITKDWRGATTTSPLVDAMSIACDRVRS